MGGWAGGGKIGGGEGQGWREGRERRGGGKGLAEGEGGIIAEWVRVFARACVCKRVRVGASTCVGDVGADILRAVDRETRRLPS